jgi:hypothetical protein
MHRAQSKSVCETQLMPSQIGAVGLQPSNAGHMKHPSVCQLFEYWDKTRGARPLPRREDIEPEAIRGALADTFILSFAPRIGHPVRVAGTRVCALFGRELKGQAFLDAFSAQAREEMNDLITIIVEESVGLIASADVDTASHFELLLLPLSLNGGGAARLLGALVSGDPSVWPRTHGTANLTLGSYRFVGAVSGPHSAHARASPLRARPQLVVYEGGRG